MVYNKTLGKRYQVRVVFLTLNHITFNRYMYFVKNQTVHFFFQGNVI